MVVFFLVAAALTPSCRWGLPKVVGCAPQTTRCGPSGIPETCSPARAWTPQPTAQPCQSLPGGVCCYAPSIFDGRPALHRCAVQTACLPEPVPPAVDAATLPTDAVAVPGE